MGAKSAVSMRRVDQLIVMRRLLAEITRDISTVDDKIAKLEERHERLIAQRNDTLRGIGDLENHASDAQK